MWLLVALLPACGTKDSGSPGGGSMLCNVDADDDGFGSSTAVPATSCTDQGLADNANDCDDDVATTHPGATETAADDIDQDCDGNDLCYEDLDGDGYGGASLLARNCAAEGLVGRDGDCDDSDAAVHAAAGEIPLDAIDQDCDGGDACANDSDGDGFGTSIPTASADADCADEGEADDTDDCLDVGADGPATFPGAAENESSSACMTDADGDGYGSWSPAEGVTPGGDCDDASTDPCPAIHVGYDADGAYHPGAKESCDEPFDYNCDDSVEYTDDDTDGWAACEECDDTDGDVRPDGTEVPADGVDQDCDGGDSCFADEDLDGFGGSSTVPSVDLDCRDRGEDETDDDCLDSGDGAAATWPGAAFEDSSTDCMTDADGDGYGALVPASGVDGGSDCNDAVASAHPGADEVVADGIDEDCDTAEICFSDSDGDGHGGTKTVSSIDLDCADPGEASSSSDCDDDDSASCFKLGNYEEFPDSSSHSADYLLGTLLVVPTDMTVTAMGLVGKSATGNVRMALYTDSSGAPDAFVMETPSTAVPVGVLEVTLDKPVGIPAGNYWIMGIFDVTASIGIAFPKGEVVQYRSMSYSDPMPGTFGAPSTYTGQLFNYYIVGE